MSLPIRVTILSREDCHLCDVVYRIATHLQSELHIETSKVSIESDRVLMERYGARVPVILLDEVEQFEGNVTEGELRRAIKKARWRRPISRILSRLGYAPKRGDHFSGIRVTSNLKRPTRRPQPGQPVAGFPKKTDRCLPIWPCIRRRLPCQ